MLVASTGCGLGQAIFCYRPCSMRGDCDLGGCDDGCDDCCPTCGATRPGRLPAYSPRRAVASADCRDDCDCNCGRTSRRVLNRGRLACDDCGCDPCSDPCDPCGDTCGRPWIRGPFSCLFALVTRGSWWGSGCGERYWGDFYSDPPDCWDPCDGYGNYSGGGCHSCGRGGCDDGYSGCSNCGRRHRVSAYPRGGVYEGGEGEIIDDGDAVPEPKRPTEPAPKPVNGQPHKAVRN
jgi:hypothetical protein